MKKNKAGRPKGSVSKWCKSTEHFYLSTTVENWSLAGPKEFRILYCSRCGHTKKVEVD